MSKTKNNKSVYIFRITNKDDVYLDYAIIDTNWEDAQGTLLSFKKNIKGFYRLRVFEMLGE